MPDLTKIALLTNTDLQHKAEKFRVNCFSWSKLDESDSLSDYDTIVLDLVSCTKVGVRWHIFEKILNPFTFRDILIGGGRIIILGNPVFEHQSVAAKRRVAFLNWTGMRYDWTLQSGDTCIEASDQIPEGIATYMSYVDQWSFSLRTCEPYANYLKMLVEAIGEDPETCRIRLHFEEYYKNRYNCSLAYAIYFVVERATSTDSDKPAYEEIRRMGPLIFLPETTASKDQISSIILRDICQASTGLPEPGWADSITVAGQDQLEVELIDAKRQAEMANERLLLLKEHRQELRQYLRLLYDTGSALGQIVRRTLVELGAIVQDPESDREGDGWIHFDMGSQTCEGILKICGTTASRFDEKELTQLDEWVSKGISQEQKRYKGIFIGNQSIDLNPEARQFPFTHSFKENARLRGIVALTTEDLYRIYLLSLEERLKPEMLWSELFGTDGVFDAARVEYRVPSRSRAKVRR